MRLLLLGVILWAISFSSFGQSDSAKNYFILKTSFLQHADAAPNLAFEIPLKPNRNIELTLAYHIKYIYPFGTENTIFPFSAEGNGLSVGIGFKMINPDVVKKTFYHGPAIKVKWKQTEDHEFPCLNCTEMRPFTRPIQFGHLEKYTGIVEYRIGYFDRHFIFEPFLGFSFALHYEKKTVYHEITGHDVDSFYDNKIIHTWSPRYHISLGFYMGNRFPLKSRFLLDKKN